MKSRVRENQLSRPRGVFIVVLFDLGEGGLVVTRDRKMAKKHEHFHLFISLSVREADGASVKCSAAPLFPGGVQWGSEGDSGEGASKKNGHSFALQTP